MEEIWKDIPGYVGKYQVSDMGRVRSLPRTVTRKDGTPAKVSGGVLNRKSTDRGGHRYVKLSSPDRTVSVHTLVMTAFMGPCPDGMEVCHNDGDPSNNRLTNLRYDTRKNNLIDMARMGRASRQKLSADDALTIRAKFKAGARKYELAKEYGVSWAAVNSIINRRNYAWL